MDIARILTAVSIIGGLIVIGKAAWSVLKYVVENIIQPLSDSVKSVQQTARDLQELVDYLREEHQKLRERVVVCEQSTKSAHHRVDALEEIIHKQLGIVIANPDRRE